MNKNVLGWCALITIYLLLLLLPCTIPTSIQYVRFNEYALLRNSYTSEVDKTHVMRMGKFFNSPVNDLIVFPRNVQGIDFLSSGPATLILAVFNDQGLEFVVDVYVQYRVKEAKVGELFDKYGLAFADRIRSLVHAGLKDTASTMPMTQYVTDPLSVRDSFRTEVETIFANPTTFDASIELIDVQLGFTDLPQTVLDRYIANAVTNENNKKLVFENTARQIRANTTEQVGRIEADERIVTQNAAAEAKKIVDQAMASSARKIEQANAAGIAQVMTNMNITDAAKMSKFMQLQNILGRSDVSIKLISAGGSNFQGAINIS